MCAHNFWQLISFLWKEKNTSPAELNKNFALLNLIFSSLETIYRTGFSNTGKRNTVTIVTQLIDKCYTDEVFEVLAILLS